jgi:hypothetical protein
MHEGGHLLLDQAFGADPRIRSVKFGPIPFFAIVHDDLSPRRELAVSSVGLWVQDGTNEWLLATRPDFRGEHAPFVKGIFAFNVLTSIGYGTVAMARAGPFERDTRGIADAARVDERAIGALVMAPAILDAYRYFRPESRWAVWASRAAKVGSVLLILK